jgi:hypothetical protein
MIAKAGDTSHALPTCQQKQGVKQECGVAEHWHCPRHRQQKRKNANNTANRE